MNQYRRLGRLRRIALAACTSLSIFSLGDCDFTEISTTTTTTLSTRDVALQLAEALLVEPIRVWVNDGVNNLFDNFEDDD